MDAPTFFGEVVEPFSRAVDEEEDEEDAEIEGFSSSVLRWSPAARKEIEDKGSLDCNILCIAIGPTATGFADVHFLRDESVETVAVICSGLADGDFHSLTQDKPEDKTCYVYRFKEHPTYLFCQCKADVSPEQSYSWVDQLLGKVSHKSLYVSVLDSRQASHYLSEQAHADLHLPLLRALKSDSFHGTPACPYLEQPNVVEGLSAQILAYCQVKRLVAVLYICYTETMFLEVGAMKKFESVLTVTPFKDIYKAKAGATATMEAMVEKSLEGRYLYI